MKALQELDTTAATAHRLQKIQSSVDVHGQAVHQLQIAVQAQATVPDSQAAARWALSCIVSHRSW